MANYITIDSGTTNTRISLMLDGAVADVLKFRAAIADTKDGKKELSRKIRDGIDELLKRNQKFPTEITRILACGMITSEFGLMKLEHIPAPCGLEQLSQNLFETTIEEISEIPFVFVRGIKYMSNDHIDVMRGEETEIYGICDRPEKNSLYVLPGSHSKLIYIDENRNISHFSTELTGEMISAVANHTILKNAIDLNQSAVLPEYLQKGYCFSNENGMNAALFRIRTLKAFYNESSAALFSFFIGVILAPEINNIIKSPADKIIIGGKNQLKEPTAMLLKLNSEKQVETVSETVTDSATAYGCVRIYEKSLKS